MVTAERRAEVVWRGDLQKGSGTFDLVSSAAAHASCYAMAFSNVLAEMGNEPEELNISAVCTFDVDQVKVTTMVLDVRGRVPGLDAEEFQNAAEQGEQACPVSNALRGNVDIQLNASLA